MESGVDQVLELPLDAEKVYEAAGLILEETTVKDGVENQLTDTWAWL
jgi:hypothetical protein